MKFRIFLAELSEKYKDNIKSNIIHTLTPFRISLIYLVLGLFWILISDNVAEILFSNTNLISYIQTLKGVLYIAITALILYLLMNASFYSLNRSGEELRESEEIFRSIFSESPIGIEIFDSDGKMIDINRACLNMFGISDSKMLDAFRLFEDPNFPEEHKKHLLEGEVVRFELAFDFEKVKRFNLYETKKSGISYLDVLFTPLSLTRKTAYLGQLQDITDSKRLEEERKKAEEQIQRQSTLLEAINKVFYETLTCETDEEVAHTCLALAEELTNSKFGFIREVNKAGNFDTIAMSDPGWSDCKIPKSDSVIMIHNIKVRGLWGKVIREEKSLITNNPVLHPDSVGTPEGHPRLTSFLAVPLKHGSSTIGVIALGNKTSGYNLIDQWYVETLSVAFVEALYRKRAEMALRQQQEWLEVTLSSISEGVIATDPNELITFINPIAEKLTGWTANEAMGRKITEVFHIIDEQSRQVVESPIKQVLQNSMVARVSNHILLISKDAREIPINDSGALIRNREGAIIGVVLVFHDITDSRKMENQLKQSVEELQLSNEELQQFAYVASHDLQEPLRMVNSYVQLLAQRYKDKLDSDANDFINYAMEGSERMHHLINDLLSYSRVGTKGKPFKMVKVSSVLSQALKDLEVLIKENNAVITYDTLPTLTLDEGQLVQVFENLIENAIKFRSEEDPRVHISVQKLKTKWLFSVSDNGIGIDKQYHDQIFKIFQRLHTRREYRGTGIGLSICKKIIERHGGRIWVESELEKGSNFYFTIPIRIE